MPESLLSARERVAWLAAFLFIAGVLVVTRFTSIDSDSALYASISAKLSEQPIGRWIAPEWWGLWSNTGLSGYFRECPAGLFLIPAALGRLGLPAMQASYIFGVASGLAALLLTSLVAARLTSREDGRAVLVLLQLMPVAFIFRIRDNHEYPMLVCLLVSIIGLEGVSRSWRWLPLVALGFAGGLLVKGAFVVFVLMAAALWILLNPTSGSRGRQLTASAVALAVMALVALAYDAWYRRATGGPFWAAYWTRQISPLQWDSPVGQAAMYARHIGFYILRLLFHPAPWSLVLLWEGWTRRAVAPGPSRWRNAAERRGLLFALAFAVLSVLLLSVPSRFAERYAFSATFLIGAAGVVVAGRSSPRLRALVMRADRSVPALPVLLWLALMALRLTLGPWLPRIGG